MSSGISFSLRVGASLGAWLIAFCAVSAFPADSLLFPTPIHLTREIRDPLSGTVNIIDEYYFGNRVVSVRGAQTSIADYDKAELMEIDRERGAYSVSRFDEIARALNTGSPVPSPQVRMTESEIREALEIRNGAPRRLAGRLADVVEVESRKGAGIRATVALDRQMVLTRDAFDVVTGGAWPSINRNEHMFVAAAAREFLPVATSAADQKGSGGYRLPLEQTLTYQVDGESLQFRSTVTAMSGDLPPPEILLIPRGAQKVEGAWVKRARMLEQLEAQ
jgi:hypothetical protein